jgi:hypothetical protein
MRPFNTQPGKTMESSLFAVAAVPLSLGFYGCPTGSGKNIPPSRALAAEPTRPFAFHSYASETR